MGNMYRSIQRIVPENSLMRKSSDVILETTAKYSSVGRISNLHAPPAPGALSPVSAFRPALPLSLRISRAYAAARTASRTPARPKSSESVSAA